MKKLLMLLLMFCSGFSQADDSCPDHSASCVETGRFNLAVAMGVGQRTNPLHQGENVPLVVMPDISYYGKNWFWDNTTAGYSLTTSADFAASVIVKLNPEKGYFQRWFAGNFDALGSSSTGLVPPDIDTGAIKTMPYALVTDVNSRPTAWDAGIQLNWFGDDWQFGVNLLQDVSGQYKGQNASMSISQNYPLLSGQLGLSAGVHWKSRKLIDTYYGVGKSELFYLPRYDGRASWQPEFKVSWQKAFTEQWSFLSFYRMLLLDNAMTDSPLVRNDRVHTWFVGVSYQLF